MTARRSAARRWRQFLVALYRRLIGDISGCFARVFWPPYEQLETESRLSPWRSACIRANADDSFTNRA